MNSSWPKALLVTLWVIGIYLIGSDIWRSTANTFAAFVFTCLATILVVTSIVAKAAIRCGDALIVFGAAIVLVCVGAGFSTMWGLPVGMGAGITALTIALIMHLLSAKSGYFRTVTPGRRKSID